MQFTTRAGHAAEITMRATPDAILFSFRVRGYTPADAEDIAAALVRMKDEQFPGDQRPLKLDDSPLDHALALVGIAQRALDSKPVGWKQRRLRERIVRDAATAATTAVNQVLGR